MGRAERRKESVACCTQIVLAIHTRILWFVLRQVERNDPSPSDQNIKFTLKLRKEGLDFTRQQRVSEEAIVQGICVARLDSETVRETLYPLFTLGSVSLTPDLLRL